MYYIILSTLHMDGPFLTFQHLTQNRYNYYVSLSMMCVFFVYGV